MNTDRSGSYDLDILPTAPACGRRRDDRAGLPHAFLEARSRHGRSPRLPEPLRPRSASSAIRPRKVKSFSCDRRSSRSLCPPQSPSACGRPSARGNAAGLPETLYRANHRTYADPKLGRRAATGHPIPSTAATTRSRRSEHRAAHRMLASSPASMWIRTPPFGSNEAQAEIQFMIECLSNAPVTLPGNDLLLRFASTVSFDHPCLASSW